MERFGEVKLGGRFQPPYSFAPPYLERALLARVCSEVAAAAVVELQQAADLLLRRVVPDALLHPEGVRQGVEGAPSCPRDVERVGASRVTTEQCPCGYKEAKNVVWGRERVVRACSD